MFIVVRSHKSHAGVKMRLLTLLSYRAVLLVQFHAVLCVTASHALSLQHQLTCKSQTVFVLQLFSHAL